MDIHCTAYPDLTKLTMMCPFWGMAGNQFRTLRTIKTVNSAARCGVGLELLPTDCGVCFTWENPQSRDAKEKESNSCPARGLHPSHRPSPVRIRVHSSLQVADPVVPVPSKRFRLALVITLMSAAHQLSQTVWHAFAYLRARSMLQPATGHSSPVAPGQLSQASRSEIRCRGPVTFQSLEDLEEKARSQFERKMGQSRRE